MATNNSISVGFDNYIAFHSSLKNAIKECVSNDIDVEGLNYKGLASSLSGIEDHGLFGQTHSYDSYRKSALPPIPTGTQTNVTIANNRIIAFNVLNPTNLARGGYHCGDKIHYLWNPILNHEGSNNMVFHSTEHFGKNYSLVGLIGLPRISVINDTICIRAYDLDYDYDAQFAHPYGSNEEQEEFYEASFLSGTGGYFKKTIGISEPTITKIEISDLDRFSKWFFDQTSISSFVMPKLSAVELSSSLDTWRAVSSYFEQLSTDTNVNVNIAII